MKKLLYTLFAFVTLVNVAKSQPIDIKVADWSIANQYLKYGYLGFNSNTGETQFSAGVIFQRWSGSTTVNVQAIYILDENGFETDLSDSLKVNTSHFTQNVTWTPIMEKTASLKPNHKKGIVKLKWRYLDVYSNSTNPQWSSYYYASKTYQTLMTSVPSEVNPPYENANTLYRMFQPETGRHLISRSYAQVSDLITNSNWVYEHVIGFIYKTQQTNTVPLYAYYNSAINDHYYSTSPSTPSGYVKENIIGYVYTQSTTNSIPIYGYYMPGGEHFFTKNWSELEDGKYGYQYEGIAFYILP